MFDILPKKSQVLWKVGDFGLPGNTMPFKVGDKVEKGGKIAIVTNVSLKYFSISDDKKCRCHQSKWRVVESANEKDDKVGGDLVARTPLGEPTRKKARNTSSPFSVSHEPGEYVLQDGQRQALDLTLRHGYLSSDEILLLCREPLLAPVFDNPENWNGKTLIFELKTVPDIDSLVHFCRRYLLLDRGSRSSRVFVRIQLTTKESVQLSDEMLGRVAMLGRLLQSLSLINTEAITDAGVAHLTDLKSLQSLNLSRCRAITDGGVASLAKMKSLQSLALGLCSRITDGGMIHLKELKSLESLSLSGCSLITDVGVSELTELKSLQSLDLSGCRITDSGVARLVELKSLQSLGLSECRAITDGGVVRLVELKSLQNLQLSGCRRITDVGVAHIAQLKSLQSLKLNRIRGITDGGVVHLAQLKSLQSLDLSDCWLIKDDGVAHLTELKSLQSLDLSDCWLVTDGSVAHLAKLKSLRSLDLSGCWHVTHRGVQLLNSHLPNTMVSHTSARIIPRPLDFV